MPLDAQEAPFCSAPAADPSGVRERAFGVLWHDPAMPEVPRWPERAGVLVVRDGRLALIKRRRDGQTYFVVPGGSVESGETPGDAARREALEELGVVVELGSLRVCLDHQTRGGLQRQWYFEAQVDTDEIAVTGPELDHDPDRGTYEATWLPIHELTDHAVHPPVVVDLVRRHHAAWPASVIEIVES